MTLNENIYRKLAELPQEIVDKITNSKTNGGRALDAIWQIKSITNNQKLILLFLGSRMTYSYNQFTNQYQFISLAKIEEATNLSHSTVVRAINGYDDKKHPEKSYKGLIELGYLKKTSASKQQQIYEHIPNSYALTSKIFDEYILALNEASKAKFIDEVLFP